MPITPSAFCIWLTGLSGAGKSTTALALHQALRSAGHVVTVVDGDELRCGLSIGLGFSKADRHANVLRAAATARDIVTSGGIAVCALISPYRDARADAQRLIGSDRFIEVFVDTPLAVCEARDPKNLYGRCRRGEVQSVSGIDDPYELPLEPDLVLRTEHSTAVENVSLVMALLIERKLISR
jgi:sulfate adenylyltransferase